MTISPAQYRENSQLRHKWVLSPAGLCDKTIYLGEKRAIRTSAVSRWVIPTGLEGEGL